MQKQTSPWLTGQPNHHSSTDLYKIQNSERLLTPQLVFYRDLIQHNLAQVIAMAGNPAKLRPHVKTHKCGEIVRMQTQAGIHKHKCATIAEAELLANSGATDILIAYPLVGPNVDRLVKLIQQFPEVKFSVIIDDLDIATVMHQTLQDHQLKLKVYIDINPGMQRTGIALGSAAVELYRQLGKLPHFKLGGFHVYDGHHHQASRGEREKAVEQLLQQVMQMRQQMEKEGLPVPSIICGGTPTFPIYAAMNFPGLECSPGTFILHDSGYGSKFDDLKNLIPAAVVITRVISKPAKNLLTLDLGHKAIAADPPAGKRCSLVNISSYNPVIHSEEHFTIETDQIEKFAIGNMVYAIPTHICPTVALHEFAYVVEGGKVIAQWPIKGRARFLTI